MRALLEGTFVAMKSLGDGSVFQQSIELPEPGPVGFTGVVTGTEDGGYAYAYYPEKKQLP